MGDAPIGIHRWRTSLYRRGLDYYTELHGESRHALDRQSRVDCTLRDTDAHQPCERLCYSPIHTRSWGGGTNRR